MTEHLQTTVLADDHVATPELLAEHGLSKLIEAAGRRILFDTGHGPLRPWTWGLAIITGRKVQ